MTLRFCAQPGGVEVSRGEAEIVVTFPDCDSYEALSGAGLSGPGPWTVDPRPTLAVDLDTATARHLGQLLLAVTPTKEAELLDTVESGQHRIERTGDSPLAFRGRLLSQASSERPVNGGALQNRWHEGAVYAVSSRSGLGGGYVVHVRYVTRWQGESDRSWAALCTDAQAARRVLLTEYQPLEHVRGYPSSEHYAERQARLEREIRGGYEQLVSELLAGDEFAEVIE